MKPVMYTPKDIMKVFNMNRQRVYDMFRQDTFPSIRMQDILGHQDISTTMNIYADVTKELREKELGNLEAIFSKTNSVE